jgi:hypothetical protein
MHYHQDSFLLPEKGIESCPPNFHTTEQEIPHYFISNYVVMFTWSVVCISLAPMCGLFVRIGRSRDPTYKLVGAIVFLLPLEVQLCSLDIDVICNQRDGNIPPIRTKEMERNATKVKNSYNDCWQSLYFLSCMNFSWTNTFFIITSIFNCRSCLNV